MVEPDSPKNPLELALLAEIEAYLDASGMGPTVFGLEICNDANLLKRMRAGREIKLAIAERIKTKLADGWADIAKKAPPGLLGPAPGPESPPDGAQGAPGP